MKKAHKQKKTYDKKTTDNLFFSLNPFKFSISHHVTRHMPAIVDGFISIIIWELIALTIHWRH